MTVVFSVSDSGNGFPETKYNLLLINFIEYPNKNDGSGLGLSIVKVL
jgi:K+-sensing histidine kinase KdpD